MTQKRHVMGYYLDGHVTVAFCKVCSAEGDKLFDDCPQKIESFEICSDCGGSGINANAFDGEICNICEGKGRFALDPQKQKS